MEAIDTDLSIFNLTIKQQKELIQNVVRDTVSEVLDKRLDDEYVYGLQGLADIFNITPSAASRMKQTGMFDEAIQQYGKTIQVNVRKARECFGRKPGRKPKSSNYSRG